jgi:hypothetical protein
MSFHLILALAPYNSGPGGAGFPQPKPDGSVDFGLIAGAAFVLLALAVVALTMVWNRREARDRR